MNKKTFICVQSSELEVLANQNYGVESYRVQNYDDYLPVVCNVCPVNSEFIQRLLDSKSHTIPTRHLLNRLCFDGVLESGDYLIEV